MSSAQVRADSATPTLVRGLDLRFEVVVLPVSDVARAADMTASPTGWR
jgi:hypothetical protein